MPFGKRLVEQPLMQNVLADLALETEAATLLALRLARALDQSAHDPRERLLAHPDPGGQILARQTYPAFMFEAMECLGGNGYVEEAPMARFYREAPVNSIWEGSGNVACLDVLRSMHKQPDSVAVLLSEIRAGASGDPHLALLVGALRRSWLSTAISSSARRIVEMAALGTAGEPDGAACRTCSGRRFFQFARTGGLGARVWYAAQGRALRRDHRAQPL